MRPPSDKDLKSFSAKRLAFLTLSCGLIGATSFSVLVSISKERVRAQEVYPADESADFQPLPRLSVLRTLSAPTDHYFPNMVSGTSELAWSPDGQRLAAYTHTGHAIGIWSPDGKIHRELPRYNNAALTESNFLGFLAGHSEILAGPSANDASNTTPSADIAMSVLDAETGKVLRNIPGLKADGRWQENIVAQAAISPDQKFVATIYDVAFDRSVERRIGIYSTDDWHLVTKVSFSELPEPPRASAIAFSSDGKSLAVAYADDRGKNTGISIVKVGSWKAIRTIKTFSDTTSCCALAAAVSFSRDDSMVLVMSPGGGQGTGIPTPLQVFRVSDGVEVAALGDFTGGLGENLVVWSRHQDFIAFLDVDNYLFFWDPITKAIVKDRRLERSTTSILFSPDGAMFAQGFGYGIRLYDVGAGI